MMARACLFLCCLPAHATLVAIVPAGGGLVIAADSRLTFMGSQCDDAFKIPVPAQAARTIAVVTGDSVFVAPLPGGGPACDYLATTPRLLDMNMVVSDALDHSAGRISTADLSAACVRAVRQFQKGHPGVIRSYAGRELMSVVVAQFDPAHAESTIRRFVVRVDAQGQPVAADASEIRVGESSQTGVWIFGEADWVNHQVYTGPGRRFLDPATEAFLEHRQPVRDISMQQAVSVAGNVIKAATLQADIVPPPSGIGGRIRIVEIGNGPRPKLLP